MSQRTLSGADLRRAREAIRTLALHEHELTPQALTADTPAISRGGRRGSDVSLVIPRAHRMDVERSKLDELVQRYEVVRNALARLAREVEEITREAESEAHTWRFSAGRGDLSRQYDAAYRNLPGRPSERTTDAVGQATRLIAERVTAVGEEFDRVVSQHRAPAVLRDAVVAVIAAGVSQGAAAEAIGKERETVNRWVRSEGHTKG